MTTKFEAAIRAEPVELIAKWRVLEMLKEHQEIPAPEGGSAEARLVTALEWWQEDPRDLVDYDAWVEEGIAMARAALAAQPQPDACGSGAGCLHKDALIDHLREQLAGRPAPAEGDERIKALTTVIELLDGKNRSSDRPSDYVFRAVAAARAALSEPQPKGTLCQCDMGNNAAFAKAAPAPAAVPLADGFDGWWAGHRIKRVLNPAGVARMVWEASARYNRKIFGGSSTPMQTAQPLGGMERDGLTSHAAPTPSPAPVAWPDEQIDALMPPPAEASEPIMKAPGYRSAQRGEYEHVGDTPDYWTRDQVRSVVRSAIASQAPAVGAPIIEDAATVLERRDEFGHSHKGDAAALREWAGSAPLQRLHDLITDGDAPHWPNLPQTDLASRWYVTLCEAIEREFNAGSHVPVQGSQP